MGKCHIHRRFTSSSRESHGSAWKKLTRWSNKIRAINSQFQQQIERHLWPWGVKNCRHFEWFAIRYVSGSDPVGPLFERLVRGAWTGASTRPARFLPSGCLAAPTRVHSSPANTAGLLDDESWILDLELFQNCNSQFLTACRYSNINSQILSRDFEIRWSLLPGLCKLFLKWTSFKFMFIFPHELHELSAHSSFS